MFMIKPIHLSRVFVWMFKNFLILLCSLSYSVLVSVLFIFSGFTVTTAYVVFITAKITVIFIS